MTKANVNVRKEHHNVDIFIEGDEWVIIIENKVRHHDTEKQIIGYYDIVNANYPSKTIFILYLTPEGGKPNDFSIKDGNRKLEIAKIMPSENQVFCISYKHNIRRWMEKCLKEVENDIHIHSLFSQYIDILKILTKQPMSSKYAEEVDKFLKTNSDYIQYAMAVSGVVDEMKVQIRKTFWEELKEVILERKITSSENLNNEDYEWEVLKVNDTYSIVFGVNEYENDITVGFGCSNKGKAVGECGNSIFNTYKQKPIFYEGDGLKRCQKIGNDVNYWFSNYLTDIDFANFRNQTTIDLFDAEKRQAYIIDLVEDIELLLNTFKNGM